MSEHRQHQHLFHIVKRAPLRWYWVWLIRLAAVLAAIALGALLTVVVTGSNPLEVFKAVFDASFATPRKFWVMLHGTAILLSISLAVTPAFRMRFWNIGAEGQAMMGCLASAACMILLRGVLPGWAVIVCMLVCSIAAGALWGVIPAIFKARWETNETLFTLMMNYIATQLVAFFCVFWENPRGSSQIGIINQSGPYAGVGWLPVIGGNKHLLNIIVVGVMVIAAFFYLSFSKQGFELSVVGESRRTAQYLGIKVRWVTIRTMLLSGAVCGLTGLMLTGGNDHTLTTTLVGGRGFTAVMVSWLAKFNPLWMILVSFLLVFMQKGAGEIATKCKLNESFSDILIGIILFFIIGSEFFIKYKLQTRWHHERDRRVLQAAKGGI